MIDIIGLIKINESQPDRIQSLVACIRSYRFLDPSCRFILALENPSRKLYDLVLSELKSFNDYSLINLTHHGHKEGINYGQRYSELIDKGCNEFIINFMEDQFMVIDKSEDMLQMLETMKYYGVDVCKCGFFKIEQNSCKGMTFLAQNYYAKIFDNNLENHFHYNKHYGKRFYIGVNFITSRKFAKEFWSRSMGFRPHEYEVGDYSDQWKHICMIPKIEIQAAVNDDHGEPGTCMLKRQEKKWLQIMNEIKDDEEKAGSNERPALEMEPIEIAEIGRLTKENFWNALYEKYPGQVQRFCDWIDDYKKNNHWDGLFFNYNAEPNARRIKYHDIPLAMQWGIFQQFCAESQFAVLGGINRDFEPDALFVKKIPDLITDYFAQMKSEDDAIEVKQNNVSQAEGVSTVAYGESAHSQGEGSIR